jgi:hypothetical protein
VKLPPRPLRMLAMAGVTVALPVAFALPPHAADVAPGPGAAAYPPGPSATDLPPGPTATDYPPGPGMAAAALGQDEP